MPLWKKTDTATASGKPNWLTRAASGVGRLEDCYATNSGWVLRHQTSAGTREELLVPIRNLAGTAAATTTLAAANITGVYFTAAVSGGSGGSITVVYNEKVNVTNGATIAVAEAGGGGTDFNATAAAQTGVNKVVFTIGSGSVAINHIYTIEDQTISGTIVDNLHTAQASDKVIDISADGLGVGGSGAFAAITVIA
tara:strand:- start:111 stop:698 length:588 start_codon:yes stop_codon:yes gene_type:complete